jgi:hypothetical protein
MTQRTTAVLWLAAFAFTGAFVGCDTEAGKPIVTYDRGTPTLAPNLKDVTTKGYYALFPGDGITPIGADYLIPGDRFGFEVSEGKTVGVYVKAGIIKTLPLDEILTTQYEWKFMGAKQP